MPQAESVFALGICAIIKYSLPFWLCCLALFANESFIQIKSFLINAAL